MTSLALRSTWLLAVGTSAHVFLMAQPAHAHFVLEAPEASLEQNNLGDPQKMGPCGGTGTATNAVTTFVPGETITIEINETIFHPGHYRVALAPTPSALPPDPVVTAEQGDQCASVPIQDPPVFPVLVDGALKHTSRFTGSQTFEVTLPSDMTCENCTLQVLEFMSEHAAPCFYYHCANIAIKGAAMGGGGSGGQAGSGGAVGAGAPASGGTGGTGATGAIPRPDGGSAGRPQGSAGAPVAAGSGGSAGTAGPSGGAPGVAGAGAIGGALAVAGAAVSPSSGAPSIAGAPPAASGSSSSDDEGGGCAFAPPSSESVFATGALLPLALSLLWRRRRR